MQTLGHLEAGTSWAVPTFSRLQTAGFDLAERLGIPVEPGCPEALGACVVGDLLAVAVDMSVPNRVQQSRVARALSRVELIRNSETTPSEEAVSELASRLLIPEALVVCALTVSGGLPRLYALLPFTYELLVPRIVEVQGLVGTLWREGQVVARFVPAGRRAGARPSRAERTLATRTRGSSEVVRGPGQARGYAVSEVGGPDVVTFIEARHARLDG